MFQVWAFSSLWCQHKKKIKTDFSTAEKHGAFFTKTQKHGIFILTAMTGHNNCRLKCTDFTAASMDDKSLNHCDDVQVCSISEQITSFCSNLTSGWRGLQHFPAPRKHISYLYICAETAVRGSIKKLFPCAVWHETSASHPTHCRIISLSLPLSLSRDELYPEDKLHRWISIIVSLLHSCCESGGPALKAGKK